MIISDFDECVHYWLMYIGEKWKRCSECNKWIKLRSVKSKAKYCKECAKKNKNKKNLEYYHKGKEEKVI